jgi:carbon storage regulator CsrA
MNTKHEGPRPGRTRLCLSRRVGQRFTIGEDTVIKVNEIFGNRVILSIEAPPSVRVDRPTKDQDDRDRDQHLRSRREADGNRT